MILKKPFVPEPFMSPIGGGYEFIHSFNTILFITHSDFDDG